MRVLLGTLIITSLSLICIGCGATRNHASTASATGSTGLARDTSKEIAASTKVGLESLPQDGDDDDGPGEALGRDPQDSDTDGDNDHVTPKGYYDRDDGSFRAYGHPASASDGRALAKLAMHFYGAAAAEDGKAACSMLTPAFAKSVPQDLGRGSVGPTYLREATTCPAVLTLMFKHLHAQVSVPLEIVGVRVNGDMGLVLIGATNMPASYFETRREGGGWRIVGVLASPLR